MRLQNRSSSSLPLSSQPSHPQSVPPVPTPYDPAAHLQGLRVSDPVTRGASAMAYIGARDPVPRSGTSMSNHSISQPHHPHRQQYQPRHADSMPAYMSSRAPDQPSAHPRDTASVYSTHSDSAESALPYTSPESDMASIRSYDDRGPQPHYPPQGYHPGHAHPEVYRHFTSPAPSEYNNQYYTAASDVLGIGPPPGSQVSLAPTQSSIPSSTSGPYIQHPGPYGPAGGLDPPLQATASSLLRGTSSASTLPRSVSSEEAPRSGLTRSGTTNSVDFSSRKKTKAVDLSAPPYTREYVDDYRHRIKGDPDPEAHFAYAKYLIEAAKKIGANSSDQRSVRKYRDTLIAESLKVIRRLATQGNAFADAQFFLANCHGTGMLGLQVDHERAYHLYLQAAKQNHPAASYRVAVCNEIGAGTRREHPRAFAFYRKAASLGDTAAMYKLGMILLTGALGQQKNPREAIGWLRRAAEQADEENPHALHELGLLHEKRDSSVVVHDDPYAKDLFTRAAQLGYTQSQFKLGQCYEYGSVACPVDPRRSIAWYTKAAEKGDPEAELALSGWYLTGSEGVLKQSDSEAYLWARRAANKGLSKAEYAVGYYAEVGIGVKQDMELAKRWYMRAAGASIAHVVVHLNNVSSFQLKEISEP
jgi:uncharacterized protein